MPLRKAIISGKEHRKFHRGAARYARSCRNHGSCEYCRSNRQIQDKRARFSADTQLIEYSGEVDVE